MERAGNRPGLEPSQPRRFLVLLALERFDALRQLIGFSRARSVLGELNVDVARHLPRDVTLRVVRDQVEFVIETSLEAIGGLLDALSERLSRRIGIDGYDFDAVVTAGAADLQGEPLTSDAYGTGERALAQAFVERRAVVLPHAQTRSRSGGRLALMKSLQRAIREESLALHYQPKLRARSGEIAGAEGLIRWTCQESGPVAPDDFIPLAEATGDIRELSHWVAARALRDWQRLAAAGLPVRLDVNMSGMLLGDRRFTRDMIDRLAPANGNVGIEITETAMIADPEQALANLRLCAEAGIRLAIDDYGAGFSSLAYLQQLPARELKIDKSFILRLATGQRDPLLVRSTIDLAHALEMEVTAEGVESPQVLALLQVMGCDLVQGFHLSRPLQLDALIRYLGDAGARTRAPDAAIERLRRRVDAARRKASAPPGS